MNIFKFYSFLFSKSYDVLYEFKKLKFSINSIDKQRQVNLLINDFILRNINKLQSKNSETNDQFYFDFINYFLSGHLKNRIIIFSMSNYLGRNFFIFLSFIYLFINAFNKIIIGFSHNLKDFSINYSAINLNKAIPCFGFPEHAFSYQRNCSYPSSFMEDLLKNNLISSEDTILSVDEYTRPSKKIENKFSSHSNKHERIVVTKHRHWKNILRIPMHLFKAFLEYRRIIKKKNIILFFYYYEQFSKKHLLQRFIKTNEKNNINFKKIYFLHLYDIGLLKYDKKEREYIFFNYSQNCFVPPAINIFKNLNDNNYNLDIQDILGEVSSHIFSMYNDVQVNLNHHLNFLNSFKDKIGVKYRVSLQNCKTGIKNLSYSNLGYESIKKLNLNQNKNILLFDFPLESFKDTFKRHFAGEPVVSEIYSLKYYEEILDILKDQDVFLYIKPKYSVSGSKMNDFYSNLFKNISAKNIKFKLLNPYGKIEISDNKFDLIICMPYTSTFYTYKHLAHKSIFYIQKSYSKYFTQIPKNSIMGYNELQSFIKNIKNG